MVSRKTAALLGAFWIALLSMSLWGCGVDHAEDDDARIVIYWEKWTDFEGKAADDMVAAFNRREREKAIRTPGYKPIQVRKVTVSRIEQKLLVAIAGGNPPDVAGTYSSLVAAYANKGALLDLTRLLAKAGITADDYIPAFWDACSYQGRIWAVPTTPASLALHWNQRLFRDAGLDPERAPRTIEELDEFAEKLTRWVVTLPDGTTQVRAGYLPDVPKEKKRLIQLGFLPTEPGWWNYAWGNYFGGKLVEGDDVTAASPENVRAYEWIASYSKKIGVGSIQRFRSGFGNFSSPQNPFLSGRLAMQLQGVWMYNFIDKFSPGMQWKAAPFPHPAARPDLANTTLAEADILVIPTGSRKQAEAFEFLKFASSQEGMEIICKGQRKFSPLLRVSDEFWADHPHPFISLFSELAHSKNAFAQPKIGIWNEYLRELVAATDVMTNLSLPPRAALENVEERIQDALDRDLEAIERRATHDRD